MGHKVIFISMSILALSTASVTAQDYSENIFTSHEDVGVCKLKGDLQYDAEVQEYTISGSGDNIWFGGDQFHFAWKKLKGDFILSASVQFIGEGSHLHRKAGWMIRQSLDPGSEHISATVHGDGLTSVSYTHLRAHETRHDLVCRLLLEKKKKQNKKKKKKKKKQYNNNKKKQKKNIK